MKLQWISENQSVQHESDLNVQCNYRLEGDDDLFALRWFLNDEELLRFTPKSKPQLRKSPQCLPGVEHRMSNSTSSITIKRVDWNAAGDWRCQVMTEGPAFESMDASTSVQIVGKKTQPKP